MRPRPPHQLAAAIRANLVERNDTLCAKRALEGADVNFVGRGERALAPFTFVTNFQGHTLVH